ncbi:MAG: RIP metalloprotease RseP [Candidatus Brocadiia bacterium]
MNDPALVPQLLGVVQGIVLTVLAFGLMVFFHELGHFLAAKLFGVRVERFSFGLGPRLVGRTWGQTEYAISAVPIGGYVKMAGGDEGEESTGAPDEFVSKTPGQRALVLCAGPLFSVLFGIPTAMAMLTIGREVPQAKVSDVTVGSAAWEAGVRYGDRVVGLGDQEVETFEDLRKAAAESAYDTPIDLAVVRDGRTRALSVRRAKGEPLGVSCMFHSLEISNVVEGMPAAKAGVRQGDVIRTVDGIEVRTWRHFRSLILPRPGETVALGVSRDGESLTLEVTPKSIDQEAPGFSVRLPTEIGAVRPGFPAEGKLRPGDRIVAVNGREMGRWRDVEDAVAQGEGTVSFAIERDGARLSVPLERGEGVRAVDSVGLAPRPVFIVDAVEGATEPQIQKGDVVVRVGRGDEVADLVREGALYTPLPDIHDFLGRAGKVAVRREGEEVEIAYEAGTRKVGQIGVEPTPAVVFRKESLAGSIVPAFRKTVSMGTFAFVVIGKLVAGDVSISQLVGPVGIIQHTYLSVRRGFSHFLFLVHLITVNIGVFNLIPIPPLDGGRIVMVAYEKVRGRRPSRRLQEAVLLAGVAVVLMIFLVATFNDIQRLLFGL